MPASEQSEQITENLDLFAGDLDKESGTSDAIPENTLPGTVNRQVDF